MKRELAALSPTLESIRRKTRFSNSDEVSEHLVYKRVKRLSPTAVSKEVGAVERDKNVVEMVEVEKNVENGEKTPLEAVRKGKRKKFGVEQYQRRFTRSALKSNVEEKGEKTGLEIVVSEKNDEGARRGNDEMKEEKTGLKNDMKEDNDEGVQQVNVVGDEEMTEEKTGLEDVVRDDHDEGTRWVTRPNSVEGNEEMKDEKTGLENGAREDNEEGVRRVTRSLLGKGKEDGPDSCVTETSDEEGERVKADVVNGNDENIENNGSMAASPDKVLKTVTLDRIPLSVMELFETGLLEGCPVYYNGGKGPGLRGRIRAIGICCPCAECCGCKVVAPSVFEIHATKAYKRAVQYIYLENGRSLIQVLKACKPNREEESIEQIVLNAIGPLPERKVVVCQNCKEQFITVDAECAEPVCAACVMSNLSPIGPVYASRKLRRSSKFGTPQGSSSCGEHQDCSLANSVLKNGNEGKSAKSSEERLNVPNAFISPTTSKSVATKKSKKLLKKMGKQSLMPKASKSRSVIVSRSATPKASKTPAVVARSSITNVSAKKTPGKITRKDIRQHKLVFEDDVLPDGTELGYYAKGKKLLDGYKKGSGIFCTCCENVISASQFESHAGCAARRKPYCYIYTSNGVSLHELSVSLIKGREHSAKFNDDLCSICADGGDLLLCDGCPRAFHKECASLPSIPRGKWYCKYCENMFIREKYVEHNANAFAAGRVSGVDLMEQITKRSIRIVNNMGSDVSSCILCRGFDFSKSEFGPRTIILCDQCEKEYHVGCLKDHDMADLKELPDGKWFCTLHCGSIDAALQNLLLEGPKKLPEPLLSILSRKNLQNISESAADVDVSWRLLSGKIASPETRPLLSQAVAIFHESFSPISEVVSGHDLIPAMVYGRNAGTQEYGGMHCAVLTVNSVVVSAAIFRVFGPEVAELPLVATSSGNHGKGYFQALFTCIESLLSTLNVKTFVLPAAEEAESIWTKRFGFKKMTPDQLSQLKQNFWSMVRFEGTSMLHKPVPVGELVQSSGA